MHTCVNVVVSVCAIIDGALSFWDNNAIAMWFPQQEIKKAAAIYSLSQKGNLYIQVINKPNRALEQTDLYCHNIFQLLCKMHLRGLCYTYSCKKHARTFCKNGFCDAIDWHFFHTLPMTYFCMTRCNILFYWYIVILLEVTGRTRTLPLYAKGYILQTNTTWFCFLLGFLFKWERTTQSDCHYADIL